MNVTYDTKYGGFSVRWEEVTNASYRIVIQKIDEDGKTEDLFLTIENYPFIQGWDLIGYCAQESGYYGDLRFHVEALDHSGKVLEEGNGPVFKTTDYYPEEQEREIADRKIRSFSYHIGTHSSMTMEYEADSLQNCSIYNNGTEISFEAAYTIGRDLKKVSKTLQEKEWEELQELIKKGKLVKKKISDPNLMILDGGSPEGLDITTDVFDRMENRFYELGLSREDKEELLAWIRGKCD